MVTGCPQPARLRLGDGVHIVRASGNRSLAYSPGVYSRNRSAAAWGLRHPRSRRSQHLEVSVTSAMAVSIGWGVFLLEVAVLGWLLVRHNR